MTTTSAGWLTAAVLALTLTACAPTKVRPTGAASTDPLPRPDMVLVYDFAVSPEQVSLNRGLFARLGRDVSPATATEDEARVGREVAEGFAVELVSASSDWGCPRSGPPPVRPRRRGASRSPASSSPSTRATGCGGR